MREDEEEEDGISKKSVCLGVAEREGPSMIQSLAGPQTMKVIIYIYMYVCMYICMYI